MEFAHSISIYAGFEATELIGYPTDLQLDDFTLVSWNTTPSESQEWVSPDTIAIEEGLFVTFTPPFDAAGKQFTVDFVFVDDNEEDPQ
jgi:hypothetical protein